MRVMTCESSVSRKTSHVNHLNNVGHVRITGSHVHNTRKSRADNGEWLASVSGSRVVPYESRVFVSCGH